MAMSGGKDDGSPMMEMNTTPLIDVMLVLLIMFIITIPVATHSVDIDLPRPELPDAPKMPDLPDVPPFRAVGLANGSNPVGIIVPCHRVIGSDGNLTGYGGGLWRKQALRSAAKS